MLKNGPIERGTPNLARIRQALRHVVPRLGAELPAPSGTLWAGWRDYDTQRPTRSAQTMAREIARVYRLKVGTLVVTFRSDLDVPGRVELGPGDDFFVEVHSDLKTKPRQMAAVLAHEVAHIFLHHHRLRLPDTLDDEILTDTTALIYGFGGLMLDTYVVVETVRQVGDMTQTTRHERKLGYLSPDEYGYLLQKRGMFDAFDALSGDAARGAYEEGTGRHLRDLGPPLQSAGPGQRLLYWMRGLWARWFKRHRDLDEDDDYAFARGRVTFRCPTCAQRLRLPLGKTVVATCGRCKEAHPCKT